MRNLSLLYIAFFTVLTACGTGSNTEENNAEDNQEQEFTDSAHNSRNSLDWNGVYSGTLPCEDCPGIDTRITLKSDGTFERMLVYQEKENGTISDSGNFTWDESGSTVTLAFADGSTQSYKVGENILFHLDAEGNIISGELENEYQLIKNPTNPLLENKRWELTELLGQPISADEIPQVPYIEFDQETGRFSGNAGCNTFTGTYELQEGDRIIFGKAAVTMRACIDMTIENDFLKVLERADNYNVSDSSLVLNRARMAPLARFK